MEYDVVIAGGSVAGLLCAREAAAAGCSVLVAEEDHEIGTPEHCGGLVSMAGLAELGVVPSGAAWRGTIKHAEIVAPGGNTIHIDASGQKVAEISRRELDKQLARQAQRNGAEITVRNQVHEIREGTVRTAAGNITCRVAVDARGAGALVQQDRTGMLPSAQYEVYADWILNGTVQVMIDQKKYPEFFAWVIPSGNGWGKVGAAGRGIGAAAALDHMMDERGGSIVRKIYAPVWVKGPVKRFVRDGVVTVGDAAGQAKPTTAGGIYSSGMGGVYAGRAIARHLGGERGALDAYQNEWTARFGAEFERQALARRVLARMDNAAIDRLFGSVTPEMIGEISAADDFDFHAGSIVRLLGMRGMLGAAGALAGGEVRRLLGRSR